MRDVEVVRAQLVGLVAQRCEPVGAKDPNATLASFGRCRVPVSCVVVAYRVLCASQQRKSEPRRSGEEVAWLPDGVRQLLVKMEPALSIGVIVELDGDVHRLRGRSAPPSPTPHKRSESLRQSDHL